MSSDVRAMLDGLWSVNADKQNSFNNVFQTSCDYIVARKGLSAECMEYVGVMGKTRSCDERKELFLEFMNQFPGVRYLGSDKWTAADFVEVKKDKLDNLNVAIAEYRLPDVKNEQGEYVHQDVIRPEQCVGYITVKGVEKRATIKVMVDYGNGYKEEIELPKKKSSKEYETESVDTYLSPRAKGVCGFTEVAKNAFYAALEVMLERKESAKK